MYRIAGCAATARLWRSNERLLRATSRGARAVPGHASDFAIQPALLRERFGGRCACVAGLRWRDADVARAAVVRRGAYAFLALFFLTGLSLYLRSIPAL